MVLGEKTPSSSPPTAGLRWADRLRLLFLRPSLAFGPTMDRWVWIVPMLIFGFASYIQLSLTADLSREHLEDRIFQSEGLEDERRELLLELLEQSSGDTSKLAAMQAVGDPILGILLPALLLWIGLNFVLGGRATFRDALCVASLSSLILVLRSLIVVPLQLSQGTILVFTSPAAFVPHSSEVALQGMNVFDLFAMFRLYVMACGGAVVSGVPLRSTLALVGIVWLVFSLGFVGLAALFGQGL